MFKNPVPFIRNTTFPQPVSTPALDFKNYKPE